MRKTLPIIAVAAGLLVWWLLALLNPSSILPGPGAVSRRLVGLAVDGLLWRHLAPTLLEAGLGFLLATVLGLAGGYVVGKRPLAAAALAPYIAASQAVPVVAVAPLMVLWFGLGLLPKVLTCALIVFFPILVSTAAGLRSVERSLVEAARICGANGWQTLVYVEAPLALRSVLGGLKLGLTLAMTGAVVGEFIAADAGLGFLLILGRSSFDTTLVFAALAALALLAIAGYSLVSLLETRLIDWE